MSAQEKSKLGLNSSLWLDSYGTFFIYKIGQLVSNQQGLGEYHTVIDGFNKDATQMLTVISSHDCLEGSTLKYFKR